MGSGNYFPKRRKATFIQSALEFGWKWVSSQLILSKALCTPDSRSPELTLRVAKSWAFICKPLGRALALRTLPAHLLRNPAKPRPRLLQEVFGPSRPALDDIKAPLRAKDFEKIRNARAPYRVPAPSRASRKFRASAASPLRSSCPKVSKDKLVTSRPAPGSWPGLNEAGMKGREVGDAFEGQVSWAPRASGDPASLRGGAGPGAGRARRPRRPLRGAVTRPAACLCFSAGQEGILRCHPDLAGRELLRGALTAESLREQSGAGLTSLGAAERLRLAELNAQYRARFGFPFVLAARLRDREAVPRELARRLQCPPAQELRAALAEVKKIGRLRLADLLAGHPAPR